MRSPVVTRALFQCVQFSLRVELPLDCKRRRISWLRLSCPFYKVNDIVIYWGFRHREQIVPGVMETLVYPLRELVGRRGQPRRHEAADG